MSLESNVTDSDKDQLRGRIRGDKWKCWSFSLNSCLDGNKSIAADINKRVLRFSFVLIILQA